MTAINVGEVHLGARIAAIWVFGFCKAGGGDELNVFSSVAWLG